MEIKLELREESWKNLFEVIRDSQIKSKGNFWASIQYLEKQFEELKTKKGCGKVIHYTLDEDVSCGSYYDYGGELVLCGECKKQN